MVRLEDLAPGMILKGIRPQSTITIIAVTRHGADSAEIVYKDAEGGLGAQLFYRTDMDRLEEVTSSLPWSFTGDGATFKLVTEAYRIHLAYLFDPLIAVHMSLVEPLPHQITAVYETMLSKQPLRYLLADDPGAGKTIMTGLLIKELMVRGDLHRCLIVAPGNLVEQWQDELQRRFHLAFEILTNDRLEAAVSGNALQEMPLCIARLDKLARSEEVQGRLAQTEWDLVVVDEAHKMSATFFGNEANYTRRYRLGELLGKITRHFLLLTATPHNGKDDDFQLFLRLLDPDRFAGMPRPGSPKPDVSDIMRHLVKEQLYTFESTRLFPERYAHTRHFQLSSNEQMLYDRVTAYVREEFNRADMLENPGRKGTVGFALTILQRRLASSPEAIYQSLKRRHEKLRHRLLELQQSRSDPQNGFFAGLPLLDEDALEDLEDAPDLELEDTEELLLDRATSARTIAELETEILTLSELETLALRVRMSRQDSKWAELSRVMQDQPEMRDPSGQPYKLIIFTEHRDTLNYLSERIRDLLGRPEGVVAIHGGLSREERARQQQVFTNDPLTQVLIATDAAGEGINLQRAHLMVNYDLPWNPNRLEQRFGRIHRIGQRYICHLWNLVANDTREGDVFQRLFEKLEAERDRLGGRVFDVLGDTFSDRSLRDLIIQAIREGERPEVQARLFQVVEDALDHGHLQSLLDQRALTNELFDISRIQEVREMMERAQARRLQPHFIAAFFLQAFASLEGRAYRKEEHRYELTYVPAALRRRAQELNPRAPLAARYGRITFEKELASTAVARPQAEFIALGHPLLDATIDLLLSQSRGVLTEGTILVDEADLGQHPRLLFTLEHRIQDARPRPGGQPSEVSRRLHFIAIDQEGQVSNAGPAPYLDYRPLREEERELIPQLTHLELLRNHPDQRARTYAIEQLVPEHLHEVRTRREAQIRRTMEAVNERLSREITYWSGRAATLRAQEASGKINARLNSNNAQHTADDLAARREQRLAELEQERHLSSLPPVVVAGALIIPRGLLDALTGGGEDDEEAHLFARETALVERLAMQAVIEAERRLGHTPRDVSIEKCGYDILSLDGQSGHSRFIEVKGRREDATTVTVSRNEILVGLSSQEQFILAIACVDLAQQRVSALRYVRHPFDREPDPSAASVNYKLQDLWGRGSEPG